MNEPLPVKGRVAHVVGVKFRSAGAIHEYDAAGQEYRRDEYVMVDTDQGQRAARVVIGSQWLFTQEALKPVLRRCSGEELGAREQQQEAERRALLYCKERVRQRGLQMKVVHAELSAKAQRAVFYFASEERIDFRDLVRDLSQHLRMRIELRQIGVRDEAKLVGGIGSCGRELCCSTFLPAFMPVSIKMAKDQGIVLNPTKLSGQCGRLKCCLVYEHDMYKQLGKGLPKLGKRVNTPGGTGKVIELDILQQQVRVLLDEGGSQVFPGPAVSPLHLGGGGGSPASPEPDSPPPDPPSQD